MHQSRFVCPTGGGWNTQQKQGRGGDAYVKRTGLLGRLAKMICPRTKNGPGRAPVPCHFGSPIQTTIQRLRPGKGGGLLRVAKSRMARDLPGPCLPEDQRLGSRSPVSLDGGGDKRRHPPWGGRDKQGHPGLAKRHPLQTSRSKGCGRPMDQSISACLGGSYRQGWGQWNSVVKYGRRGGWNQPIRGMGFNVCECG